MPSEDVHGGCLEPAMAHLDHQGSYPRVLLVFFGIADVTFVRAENPARSAVREKSVGNARAAIASLFA